MVSNSSRFSPTAAFSIALMIILSGCAGSELKNRSLSKLPKKHRFTCADSSISGSYAILDAKECKHYLGGNVLKKGYQPIYVSLTNNSNHVVQFAHDNVSLPTVSADKVAHAIHSHTAVRAVGFGIPGAIGVTGCAQLIAGAAACPPIFVFVAPPAIVGGALCALPVILSTRNSRHRNENIDDNFAELSLRDRRISPQCSLSGFFFVPKKSFNPNFEITLTDSTARAFVLHTHTHA